MFSSPLFRPIVSPICEIMSPASQSAWFLRDIWHKYHLWYFKIVSNFTRLITDREIMYNNFKISLVAFMPNITTNHAITYTRDGQFWKYRRMLT